MKEVARKDLETIRQAFYSIFKDKDPFGEMFQQSVKERIILCPIEGYFLDNPQFNSLMEAVDDEKIIISQIEGEPDCFLQEGHRECFLPLTYEEYTKLPIYVENAIYSPHGAWGILISHEEHAVLGGTEEFLNRFKNLYPDWIHGLTHFNEKWEYNRTRYNSNTDWLPKFLAHITNNQYNS